MPRRKFNCASRLRGKIDNISTFNRMKTPDDFGLVDTLFGSIMLSCMLSVHRAKQFVHKREIEAARRQRFLSSIRHRSSRADVAWTGTPFRVKHDKEVREIFRLSKD